LLRVATADPCVTNVEIAAPTLDDLYAHFLRENAA
jgi:Cu-processing system ATP-binding protein